MLGGDQGSSNNPPTIESASASWDICWLNERGIKSGKRLQKGDRLGANLLSRQAVQDV
jgi:hypothetical protein